MTRKLVVGTGWKMNKTAAESRIYISELLRFLQPVDLTPVEVFVFPPFTSLAAVAALLENSPVSFGGQNMHWESAGAWTGEISAPMLVEAGCRYVELGHSERRSHFNETDESVNRKVLAALHHRLIPVICIGETQEEKALGRTEAVLSRQAHSALWGVPEDSAANVILAYEPRWAIGHGEAASPEYIQNAHCFIRACLADEYSRDGAEQMRVIYGGSVNLHNAPAIIAQKDVDGLFIGRAALDAHDFAQMVIIVAAESVRKQAYCSREE